MSRRTVVGLVCERHSEPSGLVDELGEGLRSRLAEVGEGDYDVHVQHERLPAGEDVDNADLLKHLGDLGRRNGWELTLCIVDIPMSADGRPIVADANLADGTALVSVPAFGAMHLKRRVGEILEFLVRAHARSRHEGGRPDGKVEHDASGPAGPFQQVRPQGEGLDLRILATRGRWRQLLGMVRANRPWRLILGMTGALAAALAIGAYVLINSSTWQLALNLGPVKLAVGAIFAVALMVGWLILDHKLWTPSDQSERAGLYNASTVLTLLIGVLCMYAGVFVVVLAASSFTMDPGYFRTEIGRPIRFADYLTVSWMATSMSIVAGALGSGFESEEAVKQAAYSRRERERRSAGDQSKDGDRSADDRNG